MKHGLGTEENPEKGIPGTADPLPDLAGTAPEKAPGGPGP